MVYGVYSAAHPPGGGGLSIFSFSVDRWVQTNTPGYPSRQQRLRGKWVAAADALLSEQDTLYPVTLVAQRVQGITVSG